MAVANNQSFENPIYGEYPYPITDHQDPLGGRGFSTVSKMEAGGGAVGGVSDGPGGFDDIDEEFDDFDENSRKERRVLEINR